MLKDGAVGTLVIPEWKSAPYWPVLSEGNRFKYFVKNHKIFPGSGITHRGRGRNGIFGIGLRDKIKDDVKEAGVDEESELFKYAEHMSSYIVNSRSDNTAKSYFYAFKRWETFIKKHGFQALPAQPVHIALYITYLLDTGATCNTINSAIYSIKWVHEMSNFADPTKNSYLHSLQESAKRVATVKKHKKDPVSLDMLLQLCRMFSDSQD
ncbi:Hypothetical predicted protein [Mytilus galloprovincialis]|uniref:Core-binding (CB) domain-containing protein n=1 Tax=Mytilus galloprovincialis TaxID=29158 RepID=A0A8B6H668_MYTGA|nr:Hypothetical predicted protein [Mytilus galloprovincialis]